MAKPQLEVNGTAVLVLAGVVAAGALVWWVSRKGFKGATTAAVGAVGDAAAGAVVGVGSLVGIPDTSQAKGITDLQAGDWWSASFDLPAGDFLGAVWDKVTGKDPVAGITGGKQSTPAPSSDASLNTDFNYSNWTYGWGA